MMNKFYCTIRSDSTQSICFAYSFTSVPNDTNSSLAILFIET